MKLTAAETRVVQLLASGRYTLVRGPLAAVKTPRTGAFVTKNGEIVRRAAWALEPTAAAREDDQAITVRHPAAMKLRDAGLIREMTAPPMVGAWRRTQFNYGLTKAGRSLAATLTMTRTSTSPYVG